MTDTYLNSCIRCLKGIIANEAKSTGVSGFRVSHYLEKRKKQYLSPISVWVSTFKIAQKTKETCNKTHPAWLCPPNKIRIMVTSFYITNKPWWQKSREFHIPQNCVYARKEFHNYQNSQIYRTRLEDSEIWFSFFLK